ncbi:hypothetical protein MMPV_000113 [Pyropia vietnamensis]
MRSASGIRGLLAIARTTGRTPAHRGLAAGLGRAASLATFASTGERVGLAVLGGDGPRLIAASRCWAAARGVGASVAAVSPSRSLSAAVEAPEDTLTVPEMGESITEGTVAAWLVEDGQTVVQDEVVVQIETDKVTVDVRAPSEGMLVKQKAAVGDTVAVGQPLASMRLGAVAAAESSAKSTKEPEAPAPEAAPEAGDAKPAAAPPPSANEPVPVPPQKQINMSESGERRVKMTRMRKRIADRLKEAQNTAAMLTTFNEVDMSALIDLRNEYKDAFEKRHGVKLGFMSPFIKAATVALQEQPEVNAFIDGDDIVYRDYVDVSVAVSTPTGLVVPVLRSCEKMGFAEIEKTITNLGTRARGGQLGIDEMQGGTFTISNGGVFGSLLSTPIINMPQSAILGMHIIQKRAMVIGNEIQIRPMMYLALSYDHRLIDGREAVTFLRRMKRLVEDPRRLLLEVDM